MNSRPRDISLLYVEDENPGSTLETGRGRIANVITRSISHDVSEQTFNSLSPDNQKRLIESRKTGDEDEDKITLFKPVVMTPEEYRLTLYLADAVSRELENPQIQEAIVSLRDNGVGISISRRISLEKGAKAMYGGTRTREKEAFAKLLCEYSDKTQLLMLGDNPTRLTPVLTSLVRLNEIVLKEVDITKVKTQESISKIDAKAIADFLKRKEANKDNKKEKSEEDKEAEDRAKKEAKQIIEMIEGFDISFGRAFFYNLDKQWAYLSPQTYRVLTKNKTELFQTLHSYLLSNYITFKNKADIKEKNFRKEMRQMGKVSLEEYAQKIKECRREALALSINADSLKLKLTRDYDSSRTNKQRFWKDLEKATNSLKEIDLITDWTKTKGAKGQDKITFFLSDTYNNSDKGNSTPERFQLIE